MTLRFDKLGVVIAAIVAYAAFAAPFATFRANRIVPGQARSIIEALPVLDKPGRIHHYEPGSWGPEAAHSLLHGHRSWQEPWLPQRTQATN